MRYALKLLIATAVAGTVSLSADELLATVNGVKITKDDANSFVQAQNPSYSFDKFPKQTQKVIVDQLIEKELFAEAAQKEHIDKKQKFKENMQKVRKELMVSMWIKEQMDNTLVSDSEAKKYYEQNRDKHFTRPPQIHARHILVKEEKDAKNIIDQLKGLKGKELKDKFIELAKSKSTGPSGKNGGDLGFFTKGQMVPPFSKAAWALKVGEVTKEPVKTQFGYHIIYLEEKRGAKATPYEKVKDAIISSLKQTQFKEKLKAFIKEMKSKANIVMPKTKTAKAAEKK